MAVFLCFVFLMTALFIVTPKTNYSSLEKRYLEDFPEAKLKAIADGTFEKGFEDYLADHFPLRNMWVGINAYSNLLVGNNGNDGVYKCSDNYLINQPVGDDNRVETNTSALISFKENIDVPMTVMTAPSTGYIMADKLPSVHREYRTTYGAYTAYVQLMKSLAMSPAKKSDFNITSYKDFYGTTYSTSGFWFNKPDTIELWESKKSDKVSVEITEGDESKTYDSMYFKKHLEEDDKYPVFLDGNHALETITNDRVKKGSVLVIKDSFSHCLAPFLAENFHTVTLVDLRYYKNSVSELVKTGKYDRVLAVYGIDNFATDTDLVWLS